MTSTEHPELKEPNEITEETLKDQLPPLRNLKPNNNRHIVTFGIIIIIFTLYITAAAIRLSNSSDDSVIDKEKYILQSLQEKENRRQAMILEKLLEHENICNELEIFIKDFKWNEKLTHETDTERDKTNEKTSDIVLNSAKSERKDIDINSKSTNDQDTNNNSIEIEDLNKNVDENKKEQAKKKNTTAEPIIYLFALVFIYLLLKAASDINQHYKSQAKGDKRLRRCSLQSYAQTHKQDRRASKDKPLAAINQRQHFLEQRSQSFDRPSRLNNAYKSQIYDFNRSPRKNSSVEAVLQGGANYRYPSNLACNITEKKVISQSDILISDLNISPNRRCSVPTLLNAQKQKLVTTSKISDISRRTSIVYGTNTGANSLQGSIENVDLQFSENKRRVRMINRH